MRTFPFFRWTTRIATAVAVTSIAAYATLIARAWRRYGTPPPPGAGDRDALLDRFMPVYDVVERHRIFVAATDFAQQILNKQGGAAQNAQNLASGQQVVVSTLQDAMNQTSGVNIDNEMEKLIQLQTTYSANARVVTTINQMLQSLMTMGMG